MHAHSVISMVCVVLVCTVPLKPTTKLYGRVCLVLYPTTRPLYQSFFPRKHRPNPHTPFRSSCFATKGTRYRKATGVQDHIQWQE